MIQSVSADVNKFAYVNEFKYENGSVATNKNTYYGKEYVPNGHPNTVDAFSLYTDDFSVVSNSVSLTMSGYFQFSYLYDYNIKCSHLHTDEIGVTWCTEYDALSTHGLSFQIQLMFDNNLTSSFCDINMISKDGFFTFTCPVLQGAKKVERIIFRTLGSNLPFSNIPTVFLGVRRDVIFLVSETSSVTGAIKDQTDQQHRDSQEQLEESKKQTDAITSESEDVESSSCGLICKIGGVFKTLVELPGKLISLLIDALKSLFIPKDMSFINNFMESIENKLGFIASIPMSVIRFTLNLATASWEDFTSITFPSISIFGYNFWQSQEIDLTDAINIFKPFKYFTDIVCVTLFCSTLLKWYERFSGGDSH